MSHPSCSFKCYSMYVMSLLATLLRVFITKTIIISERRHGDRILISITHTRIQLEIICTTASRKYAHPWKYTHPSFSLQVIAKRPLLLESMPRQRTKIIFSSMHNDEICSRLIIIILYACVWQQADALEQQQLKRMQSGSSNWSRHNQGVSS